MGMFDHVDLGPHAPKCPRCGAALVGFQTKDSPDQLMTTYRIQPDGVVETQEFGDGYADEHRSAPKAVAADFCGAWQIYGGCEKGCKFNRAGWGGKPFETELVYAQLVIVDGRLHRVKLLEEDDS